MSVRASAVISSSGICRAISRNDFRNVTNAGGAPCGVTVRRKTKTVKLTTLRSACSISGEGSDLLRLDFTRSWNDPTFAAKPGVRYKSLPLKLQALCFYLWTYAVAMPLFVLRAALQPFVLILDKHRRTAQHFENRIWSFLDIYTLFLLGRPFKFISKTSNFLIPIIGWSMYLTGHVPLKRMDRRSQLE
ncbi:hypothetical protein R1flu_005888 [Riccia fluitans]|uniref:Uncharacterized protein n=1 Tax=Riccia fluitans TaxID=41844 RepID=A0ABD1YVD3_9MARC